MAEKIVLIVEKEACKKRLDEYLKKKLVEHKFSRNYIQRLITGKNVIINTVPVTKKGYQVKENEEILVAIPEDKLLEILPENIALDIEYEDDDIIVINKKVNFVVHPSYGHDNNTLVNALMFHIKKLSTINGILRPGIVHRLDKNTSGLIIVAKNDFSHKKLTDMFQKREIKKEYICICKGIFKQKNGLIKTLIGRDKKNRKKMAVIEKNGKIAISKYSVLGENDKFSLLNVNIETGRMHQIRVHMKYLNHPILGDEIYGKKCKTAQRQMLHSYKLEFNHPRTEKILKISSKIPDDFLNVLTSLNLTMPNSK